MAIPVALTEPRDKLERAREQGDGATQGMQRKGHAPVKEVVDFRGERRVREKVAKSRQPVHKSEEREHEPEDFR